MSSKGSSMGFINLTMMGSKHQTKLAAALIIGSAPQR